MRLIVLPGGFDFGQFLPSLFLFSDPAPSAPFLLKSPLQKESDPPFGKDTCGVVIGVIREIASLADKLGLGGPVVRVNVPASGNMPANCREGALITSFPLRLGFYARKRTNRPQPDDRITRLRPSLALAPFLMDRPDSSSFASGFLAIDDADNRLFVAAFHGRMFRGSVSLASQRMSTCKGTA